MPKAVLFDCYNTLLCYESQEDKAGIYEMMIHAIEYMTESSLQIVAEELEILYQEAYFKEVRECQRLRGIHAELHLRRVWKNVLTALNIPLEMAEEKAEDILLVFRLFTRRQKHLFPNIQKELRKLKDKGMKLLLLSNAQSCFIYNELPEEVRNLFDELIISEDVGIKKPDENIFHIAFERLGIKSQEGVFVGDSAEDDMIPAGKLGCHCVMIGKSEMMKHAPSHLTVFDPYKESGYDGFVELIDELGRNNGD